MLNRERHRVSSEFVGHRMHETTDPARCAAKFLEHGCLTLRSVADAGAIREAAAALEQQYPGASSARFEGRSLMVGAGRYMVPVPFVGPFASAELCACPEVIPVVTALLGSDAVIHSCGAVFAIGGALAQAPHLDHPWLFDSGPLMATLPPYAITLMIPLIDVTIDRGPTVVWRGSHRAGTPSSIDMSSGIACLTKLGDVYLMDYRLVHGALANTSIEDRPVMYVVYARRWFNDYVNYQKQERIGRVAPPAQT